MIGFLVLIFLLSAIVAGVWWWVLGREGAATHEQDEPDQGRSNVQVYREQLAELERDWNQGVVNETEYRSTRDELTRRLLEDADAAGATAPGGRGADTVASGPSRRQRRWLAVGLALYLPLAGLGLYGWLGQPMALDPLALSEGEPDHAIDPAKLADMVARLEQRLKDEPQQVDGWVMLARVQRARDHLEEADKAYTQALSLSANDDVAIERAEVLARLRGGFNGEPWQIIERVIKADPEHVNARLLAGSAAYAEGRYALALQHWGRVQGRLPAGSPEAPALEEAMQQARAKLGPSAPAVAAARISGRVTLAPQLASRVAPTDTVFIYATPAQGSRMPLAIARVTVSQLPYNFVLDESSAMNPQATLAGQQEVTVRARISSTGDAMPKPGELGVVKTPVKVGAQGLELRIEGPLN